jgi:hypothetical protein
MILVALAWLPLLPLGPEQARYAPPLVFALLMASSLVVFQALVWGLASFPKTRVALLTVAMIVLVVLAAFVFAGELATEPGWKMFCRGLMASCAVLWACAFVVAWFGVTLERRGQWSSFWRTSRLSSWTHVEYPRLAFRAPLQAQFWIEWRRNGRTPLVIWSLLVWLALATDLLSRLGVPGFQWLRGESGVGVPAGLIGAIWAAVTGLNLGRDAASKRLAMSTFTAVRPVGTGTLFLAKLLVGASVWVGAALILGASWFLCGLAGGYLEDLPDEQSLILISLAFGLQLFVGILPLCLTGRIPGFPWSLLPLLVIYGLAGNVFAWFAEHDQYWFILLALILALAFLKVVAACWGFAKSIGQGLVSRRFVLCYMAVALLVMCLAVQSEVSEQSRVGDNIPLLILLTFVAVPVARIAFSPLALAVNRHR